MVSHALLLAVLLAAPALRAEAPQNLLLADLGLHVVGAGYQRTLSPSLAAQVALESYTPWTQNLDLLGLSGAAFKADLQGAAVRARVFVYPWGTAPTGPWLSPFAQAGLGWATRDGSKRTGLIWAVGASAGWSWLPAEQVHLAFGAGLQFHAAEIPGGDGAPSFRRFYPTLDGSVGYAF